MKFKILSVFAAALIICNFECCGKADTKATDGAAESVANAETDTQSTSSAELSAEMSTGSESESISETNAESDTVSENASADSTTQQAIPVENVQVNVVEGPIDGVARLKAAYPDKIKDIKDNTIYFADGSTMVYDDGKEKDFAFMLDNSDPEDMFHQAYDTSKAKPDYLEDVGRTRSEQLFKKLYGSSSQAVQSQLVSVPWFGSNVKFSSSNGAAEQLKKVYKELSEHPELKKYLKSSGTFYWRNVRGANRLSAHSYGIAIDIGVDSSDYWLWKNPKAKETTKITYHNRIPLEIVEIFEKYGFVWGGRWYHFDTMHFEYRPELNPPTK